LKSLNPEAGQKGRFYSMINKAKKLEDITEFLGQLN
jgi:hypothetical protein